MVADPLRSLGNARPTRKIDLALRHWPPAFLARIAQKEPHFMGVRGHPLGRPTPSFRPHPPDPPLAEGSGSAFRTPCPPARTARGCDRRTGPLGESRPTPQPRPLRRGRATTLPPGGLRMRATSAATAATA